MNQLTTYQIKMYTANKHDLESVQSPDDDTAGNPHDPKEWPLQYREWEREHGKDEAGTNRLRDEKEQLKRQILGSLK